MKYQKQNNSTTTPRFGRLRLVIIVGIVLVFAVSAITVISRQRTGNKQPAVAVAQSRTSPGNFVTVKVAGRDIQVDPQTGQIKPLTPEEAQRLAEGLKGMLNRSTEGLTPEQQADGSISMDLKGRFQNVTVARVNEDGSVTQSCVDNREAAANFFGIDPQLLGVQKTNQPARTVQKKAIQ